MTYQLKIDPAEARHQAGLLDTAADDLAAAVASLLDGLEGLGDYCGTDASGATFAASYQPHVDRAEPALTDAVGDLSALATTLRWAVSRLVEQDDQGAAAFRAIGAAIPANPVF